MTTKEYNQIRYHSRPKHNFMTTIRSHQKILTQLGFTVIAPNEQDLDKAVDNYLASRERRSRIDHGV